MNTYRAVIFEAILKPGINLNIHNSTTVVFQSCCWQQPWVFCRPNMKFDIPSWNSNACVFVFNSNCSVTEQIIKGRLSGSLFYVRLKALLCVSTSFDTCVFVFGWSPVLFCRVDSLLCLFQVFTSSFYSLMISPTIMCCTCVWKKIFIIPLDQSFKTLACAALRPPGVA